MANELAPTESNPLMAEHSLRKREMWRLLAEKDTAADWFLDQMELISDGATLDELAKILGVHYSVYRNWIRGSNAREEAFAEAERERKTRILARSLKAVESTATANVDAPVGHGDRLRAAEILLKAEKESAASAGGSGASINLNISFVDAKEGKEVKGAVIDQVP